MHALRKGLNIKMQQIFFFFNVTIVFGKNKQTKKLEKKKANNRKTNTEKADLDLSNKY